MQLALTGRLPAGPGLEELALATPLTADPGLEWGQPGALYQVSTGALYQSGATPQLTVLWTVQHPTPIPMGPGV